MFFVRLIHQNSPRHPLCLKRPEFCGDLISFLYVSMLSCLLFTHALQPPAAPGPLPVILPKTPSQWELLITVRDPRTDPLVCRHLVSTEWKTSRCGAPLMQLHIRRQPPPLVSAISVVALPQTTRLSCNLNARVASKIPNCRIIKT